MLEQETKKDVQEEGTTSGANASSATAPAGQSLSAAQKAKRRKKQLRSLRNAIIILIVLVGIAALVYVLYQKMKPQEDVVGEVLTDMVMRGSITSMAEGSGYTKAKNTATVAPPSGGTISAVYVTEGDYVTEGQQLFSINNTDLQDKLTAAQKKVNDISKELSKLYEVYDDLTITAPFSGKLLATKSILVGDDITSGTEIATLVDDTQLKLTQYFSYAYENQITVGQTASVALPASMSNYDATVSEVNYVQRVSPEGALLFQVVFVLDNPGALTQGMAASASLTAADGTAIYPYENATLDYYRTVTIITKADGPVLSVNLMDYMTVTQGTQLLRLGTEDADDNVDAKQKELTEAQEALTEVEKELAETSGAAPISGTIMSCTLVEGEKADSSMSINISDNSSLIVSADIDDRNISYVQIGMMVDLMQWETPFIGFVETISLEGKYENGSSIFPITIRVDNDDGSLMPGMSVEYSFVTSQSDDCLIIPIQCVQYSSDPETGERVSLVFVQQEGEIPPEALDTSMYAVDMPEGFYAVQVVTGLSDNYNVEILEGLEEFQTVFTATVSADGNYW